jgi:hypothetical protein
MEYHPPIMFNVSKSPACPSAFGLLELSIVSPEFVSPEFAEFSCLYDIEALRSTHDAEPEKIGK